MHHLLTVPTWLTRVAALRLDAADRHCCEDTLNGLVYPYLYNFGLAPARMLADAKKRVGVRHDACWQTGS